MVRSVDAGMVLDPTVLLGLSQYPPAERLPRMEAESTGQTFNPPIRMFDGLEVAAKVDAGRWIACCPFCGVHSWVSPTDPRLLCSRCNNGAVGSDWVHVIFPPNRLELERVLAVREEQHQFWSPPMTAVELMGENVTRFELAPFEGWA